MDSKLCASCSGVEVEMKGVRIPFYCEICGFIFVDDRCNCISNDCRIHHKFKRPIAKKLEVIDKEVVNE